MTVIGSQLKGTVYETEPPLPHYYAALLPRRGRIMRRTLSVRLSVRPSRYRSFRPR